MHYGTQTDNRNPWGIRGGTKHHHLVWYGFTSFELRESEEEGALLRSGESLHVPRTKIETKTSAFGPRVSRLSGQQR